MKKFLYEVQESDIDRFFFKLPNCQDLIFGGWGRVHENDVGKKLFNVNGVIQMENDAQLAARKGKSCEIVDEQNNLVKNCKVIDYETINVEKVQ